jgi:hypothetical protein
MARDLTQQLSVRPIASILPKSVNSWYKCLAIFAFQRWFSWASKLESPNASSLWQVYSCSPNSFSCINNAGWIWRNGCMLWLGMIEGFLMIIYSESICSCIGEKNFTRKPKKRNYSHGKSTLWKGKNRPKRNILIEFTRLSKELRIFFPSWKNSTNKNGLKNKRNGARFEESVPTACDNS